VARIKVAYNYSKEFLEVERPQPLTDNIIDSLMEDAISNKIAHDITDNVYEEFKSNLVRWIEQSGNTITGFDAFVQSDITIGCTQFIDNLYMRGPVQTIIGDYKYHERLGKTPVEVNKLKSYVPLIISMPFPSTGDKLPNMEELLDMCAECHIPVHIDGAWLLAAKDIKFDLRHPAIESVGISLSKGLGLGWNRVGMRWSKIKVTDSISIMNDFHMNNRALSVIGLHYMKNLSPGHLWNTHGSNYEKICKDFNLETTKCIHLAKSNGSPVGLSPLLRYLENESTF
jgi:hypothetical protein